MRGVVKTRLSRFWCFSICEAFVLKGLPKWTCGVRKTHLFGTCRKLRNLCFYNKNIEVFDVTGSPKVGFSSDGRIAVFAPPRKRNQWFYGNKHMVFKTLRSRCEMLISTNSLYENNVFRISKGPRMWFSVHSPYEIKSFRNSKLC